MKNRRFHRLYPFFNAISFLTSLPVPGNVISEDSLARSLIFFPLVGIIIGIFVSGFHFIMIRCFPPPLAGAFILVFWVWITGGLHLDGFIDCCDALLASTSPEKRLEILKDTSTGAFGVTGAVLLLLVKYSSIVCLTQALAVAALFLVPVVGRSSLTYVILRYPYVRMKGMGRLFKDAAGKKEAITAIVVLILSGMLVFPFVYPPFIGYMLYMFSLLCIEVCGFWMLRRVAGFTGDMYGAICEMVETAGLIFFVAAGRLFS
jgi:adenosylcobinamide-GDP ribazoletransferase